MATPTPKDGNLGRIESEIAVVREDVGRTVQEIGNRLTPARLMEEARRSLKESTRETTRAVAQSATDVASTVAAHTRDAALDARDHVRAHPYAAGAVAAGLGLGFVLMSMSMRKPRRLIPREWDEPFDRSSRRRTPRATASLASASRVMPIAAAATAAFLLWRNRM